MTEVIGKRVANWDELYADGNDGAFFYANQHDGMEDLLVMCPSGCGQPLVLPIQLGPNSTHDGKPVWGWNGNRDAPTLTPNVHNVAPGCGWHGNLIDGVWRPV